MQKLPRCVHVRLSEEDLTLIIRAADFSRLTLSAWARTMLVGMARAAQAQRAGLEPFGGIESFSGTLRVGDKITGDLPGGVTEARILAVSKQKGGSK